MHRALYGKQPDYLAPRVSQGNIGADFLLPAEYRKNLGVEYSQHGQQHQDCIKDRLAH